MLPRLWYSVRSFSQSGILAGSPAGTNGVYGNETAGSRGGNVCVPAKVRSSNGVPFASRYGSADLGM